MLIQPARFQVEPGETSTEIDLIFAPVPVPHPIKREAAMTPDPVASPSPPSAVVSPKPPRAKPVAKPKAAMARETSSASKGAIQAQPDDLHNEPPEYPEESRIAREQGVVILRVEVTAKGEPVRVSILQSSGFFRLDQAARQAVRHWKFHPALIAGIPVSSEADVPVRFKLEEAAR